MIYRLFFVLGELGIWNSLRVRIKTSFARNKFFVNCSINNKKKKFREYKGEIYLSFSFEEFLSGRIKKEEREGFGRANAMTSSADRI